MNIACVGSRDIDEALFDQLNTLGKFLAVMDYTVVSGNAVGSDYAFASGANSHNPNKVKLYLPWRTYNSEHLVPGNIVVPEPDIEWEAIARENHEKYDELTQGAKKMMQRNVGIVKDSVLVLGALNNKKSPGMGGTGHAMRVAFALEIPFIDVSGLGTKFSIQEIAPFISQYVNKSKEKQDDSIRH